MIRGFGNRPVQAKLAYIVMAICSFLVIFMAICFIIDKVYSFRRDMVENLAILANTIGKNSTAALVFDDPLTAEDTLSALKAAPYVKCATIFRNDGTVFARYSRQGKGLEEIDYLMKKKLLAQAMAVKSGGKVHNFNDGYLSLASPIMLDKKRLGFLAIKADLGRLYNRLIISILIVIVLICALGLLAQVVSVRLHRFIAWPLFELLKTMETVKRKQKFSVRVKKLNDDEFGSLTDSFNSMLAEIEKRDEKLAQYQNQLEEQVEDRTRELVRSNEQLKKEVAERKIIQGQLARAQRMEAIGTLAAGVAHDLNNILSGIVSYPELLLMRISKEHELYGPLCTIQASGKKAAAIVQDLLTLSRRGVTAMEVVNLEKVLDEYLDSPECRKMLDLHPHVKIVKDLKPGIMQIMGSELHLGKTIMNLVINAAEAMRAPGEVVVRLENCYLDTPVPGYGKVNEGYYVLLTVRDTGQGIDEEDLEFIFEPFYTKKKMGLSGTGLGMTVVWGTVQDHKGYINVVSRPGEGTIFSLYFPATMEEKKDIPVIDGELYRGQGESILVVDDVEEQRLIATDILKELGYNAVAVSSGEEAVIYVQQNNVDLLILDMIMDPGIDGLETYRRVLQHRPRQRAIIASGYTDFARIKEARKLGLIIYLRKPYTMSNISRVVREELER